jgi:hypothetical protein
MLMIIVNMHITKAYGGVKLQLYSFPTWALHGMNSQLSNPCRFTPREEFLTAVQHKT